MNVISRAWARLLRLPLFAKILVANCSIVTLGATVGTYVTTLHVQRSPHGTHYEMMVLFAAGGLALSLVLNALVLRTALLPLARLERTARRVLAGDMDARARLGALGDPDTDRLAATFNAMLDSLRARARQVQAYSSRLQELSDRVLIAQEEERRRLACELHDDIGQVLSTLLLHLRLFRDLANRKGVDPPTLASQANELTELARETLDSVRRLAMELRPRILDDLGLVTALHAYGQEWSARTGIQLDFQCSLAPDVRVASTAEIAVYRMMQEALTNVAKHAAATRVAVSLEQRDHQLVVEVRDNGRGLLGNASAAGVGPEARANAAATVSRGTDIITGGLGAGLGMFSMQERVGLAGGAFAVESAPGQGTTVRAAIPLPQPRKGTPPGGSPGNSGALLEDPSGHQLTSHRA